MATERHVVAVAAAAAYAAAYAAAVADEILLLKLLRAEAAVGYLWLARQAAPSRGVPCARAVRDVAAIAVIVIVPPSCRREFNRASSLANLLCGGRAVRAAWRERREWARR